MVSSSSLKSGTLAPAITTESGPPSASTKIERLTPILALSVGLGPIWSPQGTGLAHRTIGRLPLEVHSAELFAFLDQLSPDEIQDVKLDPPLEGAVYRGVVGKLFGHLVPLATGAHSED